MLHPTLTSACQPWCTDHNDGDGHSGDGYCRRAGSGDVYLSTTVDGPKIFAYGAPGELSLDQAEMFFRAGLELVAAGRKGGAL